MRVRRGKKRGGAMWTHDALERRGYHKCPFCWRHLVKLEDHVAAHKAGVIGADGRRRDRTPQERRRWAERYRKPFANAGPPREFVPRGEYEHIFGIATVDIHEFRRQIDELASQEP